MAREPELSIKVKVDPQIKPTELKTSIERKVKQSGEKPQIDIDPNVDGIKKKVEDKLKNIKATASITPVVDTEKLKTDIQQQINGIGDIPKVTVGVNVDDFSSELTKQLKDQLKEVNQQLSYYLKNLTSNTDRLGSFANNIFSTKDLKASAKQVANEVSDEFVGGLSGTFNINDLLNYKISDTTKKRNLSQVENLVNEIKDIWAGLYADNWLDDDKININAFNDQFTQLGSKAKELKSILDSVYSAFDSDKFKDKLDVFNAQGFDLNKKLKEFMSIDDFLDEIIDKSKVAFKTTDQAMDFSKLINGLTGDNKISFNSVLDNVSGELGNVHAKISEINSSVKAVKTEIKDVQKEANTAQKTDTSGHLDASTIETYGQKLDKVLSNIADKQNAINDARKTAVDLEKNILAATVLTREGLSNELTQYETLFKKFDTDKIAKFAETTNLAEFIKNQEIKMQDAQNSGEKNQIEDGVYNVKKVKFDIDPAVLQANIDAVFENIAAPIRLSLAPGTVDNLINEITPKLDNIQININNNNSNNGVHFKDWEEAVDALLHDGIDDTMRDVGMGVLKALELDADHSKALKKLKETYGFDKIIKDTDAGITAYWLDNETGYDDLVEEASKWYNNYIAQIQKSKPIDVKGKVTITDADVVVDVKNPVAIPGTVTVNPTSVQFGNSDDLQKNANALSSVKQSLNKISTSAEGYGTKIAAIGPSVQYVAQEVDNLSKSLENQITDLDLIAKKTDAYGTTANSITLNSKDVAAPTAPVDIPGKVTLKVEDVTPPKGPVKIPGKVELKVSDITPPKTAIKLEGIPETPNYTKPSETLDDYRDSVGAAAGIQEYFAKEVDNATAALGSQSETLKALKKSLDEYIGSIDGVEKFAKAEKELDRLKKKLAQQQQQQPAQPAPQQPNNQPLAPIKQNSNPKPNNNGQPPAPPTPSNNRPPNNGGNNGGNNSPVESQRKLEQSLERIMTKIVTAQNKKDTSGDKGYEKNVAEQVKWQSQLQDQAEELIDKLNANYPGWEKGKSWQRHGERIAHARNDYSTAREDKQDADYVKDITSQYSQLESLYKRRVSLFKPDQVNNLRDIDDEIKRINSDLAKTYAEAKQNSYDLTGNSDIQESIDSISREKKISKRDFAKNQQQYNNAQIENLFDEYERLTSKLQTYGQRRASSIGNDNVQAQSNVLRDYINTQTELNKLESEFKNQGFLKAGSAKWQQTYDLMKKRKDLEKAVEFEVNNRIQAEQEAIRVQDEDRLSLLAYIKTIEKYKDTLEKDGKTDSSVYGKSVGMSNASWDLLNELNKNPDNKDQVAYLWGQKYNIQGVTDLESAFKALAVEAAKAGIEVQDLRTETEKLRAVTQAKTNIANLKSQLMDYLEKFPKVGKALAEPVQKLQEAFADPNAYKNAGQLKQAMAELRAQAKSLGLESENLIDKFEKLFGQHLSTMITMAALHKMQDALRIVYQNVVEIDTAVTELRKVSEYAGKSLEEYMGRAAEQAQKLGVSISDYVNSTADWKRLGYSDEDAENLATYSTLLKNVGDNIDDVNTSSSYLISTLQGFGLLADQAEDVVNKIDAVANTQPVTAKDLGEILTRSSAAMSAANNTLEETIALGTAANSVIQDADTVGTTLKSLSMYLRAAKSDAENAGIEVDGMANSVSELRSELKSLTGVDIMLDSKNFKSTYQIMKELSQVWSGLSDVTQANVTEMIGGKRNANAVSAILNNFDVAESTMESAANSANVAWEENEKYLDSIQGRLAQLDASFQVLSTDILSSGLVKSGVSFLTSIVKLLDKIINLTGALPAGLGIAAFVTQLGKPKMTGFMIVPSNTPGGDTEQVLRRYFIISLRSMREYLVKPTNMVA